MSDNIKYGADTMIKCMRKYKGYKDNKKKRENARNSCGVALETYIHKRKIKHIRKDETWFLCHVREDKTWG